MHCVKAVFVYCLILLATHGVVGQLCDNVDKGQSDDTPLVFTREREARDVAPLEEDHDLLLGNCDGLSSLFYDEVRCYEPVFNETIYTIKQYRFSFQGASIHCVNVTDLVPTGGGYPARYEGGIGRDFIDILFMSQPSQGMEFRVKVYARSGVAGDGQRV